MVQTGRVTFGAMDEVVFGQPAAIALLDVVKRLGAKRVFLMVSGTLLRETHEIARIRAGLGGHFAGMIDAMPPHTPRSAVIAATKAARAAGADLIATVGGGSITDGAKAVQLCLANDITSVEGMDALRTVNGVSPDIKPPTVRQVSIPTTIAGGEFSALSGVTDETRKVKELFKHPLVMPRSVILDPAITLHTPEWLWLSTGVRAVDHCVEGICSNEAHAYGDAQAIKGLSLLASGLARVKANPHDLDARLDCQLGTWLSMGPLSAGVPMGASHGIGYILGAAFGVPHGHTSCIMLPAAMRCNKPVNAAREAIVSEAMGHAGQDAGDVLDAFIAGLGMPRRLSDVNIGPEHFDKIAQGAMATPWVPRNPRPITSPAQVREILDLAA